MTSELETNIVSVERAKEYSETPTEVRSTIEKLRSTLSLNIEWSCDPRYDVNVQRERWR